MGTPFCWQCGKALAKSFAGPTKGELSFTTRVVNGTTVKLHHKCAITFDQDKHSAGLTARESDRIPPED